ncbi:hypothetical protein GQ44DRAFT_338174 [Phaeosphaeriaceae sp. PMI808]|nr:hypothetical protein GQ44DRAFT_338174 [Phaeosphaeriaceae sp. PMI808]
MQDINTLCLSAAVIESYEELLTLDWIAQHAAFQETPLTSPGMERSRWVKAISFSEHQYFKRVWIWQEICLTRVLVFTHKFQSLTWLLLKALSKMFSDIRSDMENGFLGDIATVPALQVSKDVRAPQIYISSTVNRRIPEFIGVRPVAVVEILTSITEIWHDTTELPDPKLKLNLWILRMQTVRFEATNRRDYIYGLLGLSQEPIEVVYDNRRSSGQLSAGEFASYLSDWKNDAEMQNGLDELFLFQYSGLYAAPNDTLEELGMPTWVPAYQFIGSHTGSFLYCEPPSHIDFTAKPKLAEGPFADVESLRLHISGVELGSVKLVEPDTRHIRPEWGISAIIFFALGLQVQRYSPQYLLLLFFQATALSTSSYPQDPLFVNKVILWMMRIGLMGDLILEQGRLVTNGRIWKEMGCENGTDFVRWFTSSFIPSGGGNVEEKLTTLLDDVADEKGESSLDETKLRMRLSTRAFIEVMTPEIRSHGSQRRGLFLTTSGLIGSGPRCIEQGDVVVFFKGDRQPHILRKVDDWDGDTWLNVGPCFLPQLANGEIEGSHDVKRFTIF